MLTFGGAYRGKLAGFLDALTAGEAPQSASRRHSARLDGRRAVRSRDTYVHLRLRTLDVDLLPVDQLLFQRRRFWTRQRPSNLAARSSC